MTPTASETSATLRALGRRHSKVGWWSLLVFLTLGLVLESLHGFKVSWYLNVSSETRRLMWTLAHAHGTLFALVNILWSSNVVRLEEREPKLARLELTSRLLLAGTGLLPIGFLLGGLFVYGGDPGLGVLLVPIGGICLLTAVALTASEATRRTETTDTDADGG